MVRPAQDLRPRGAIRVMAKGSDTSAEPSLSLRTNNAKREFKNVGKDVGKDLRPFQLYLALLM